jgi:hypothetical protein
MNMIQSITNIVSNRYREFICLLNISLIIPIVVMVASGYESFDGTPIYQSFKQGDVGSGGGGSTILINICILCVSIPMLLEILYDIVFIRSMKFSYDHVVYDILQLKIYLILAYTIPAILLCSYNTNPSLQSLICCITFNSQNLQFGSTFVLLSISTVKNKYTKVVFLLGLFVYYFQVMLNILLDLYPSIPSKDSILIVIQICFIPAYFFIVYFAYVSGLVVLSFFTTIKVSKNLKTFAPYGIISIYYYIYHSHVSFHYNTINNDHIRNLLYSNGNS